MASISKALRQSSERIFSRRHVDIFSSWSIDSDDVGLVYRVNFKRRSSCAVVSWKELEDSIDPDQCLIDAEKDALGDVGGSDYD